MSDFINSVRGWPCQGSKWEKWSVAWFNTISSDKNSLL